MPTGGKPQEEMEERMEQSPIQPGPEHLQERGIPALWKSLSTFRPGSTPAHNPSLQALAKILPEPENQSTLLQEDKIRSKSGSCLQPGWMQFRCGPARFLPSLGTTAVVQRVGRKHADSGERRALSFTTVRGRWMDQSVGCRTLRGSNSILSHPILVPFCSILC